MKASVKYDNLKKVYFMGKSALLYPLNHTSGLVSNTTLATTSAIVSKDFDCGHIETQNSVYVPAYPFERSNWIPNE